MPVRLDRFVDKIEWVPTESLIPDPTHTRVYSRGHIRKISRSIDTVGFLVPAIADQSSNIICGHARLLAAKLSGLTEVPVIRVHHLTPALCKAFGIADNKLHEGSSFDPELLAAQIQRILDLDESFDTAVLGFDPPEFDKIFSDDSDSSADDEPVAPGPPVARLGDLWVLGRHRLLCGSALEDRNFELLMREERAAISLTDFPYNVRICGHVSGTGRHREFLMASGEMSETEFISFLTSACQLIAKWSVDGSLHYGFMDAGHLYELLTATRAAFDRLITICVWHKTNAGMGSLYRSAHELIVISKKGSAPHQNNIQLGKHGRHRTNVWSHAGANVFLKCAEDADLMRQHPTPKPVQMLVEALLDTSKPGDVVLEPFCGSGSTLLAAERTGRLCRAIELDPLYVDLTIRRWRRHCGLDAVRESDGTSFAELEAQGGYLDV